MEIIYYLYILFAVDSFSVSLALPIFSNFIVTLEGTKFALALISTSTAFTSLISNPIIGSLSDSKGRRSLLIQCLLCAIVGNILFSIAPTWHFVFVGKIITAVGGSIGVLQKSILGDLVKSEQSQKAFLQKVMLIQGFLLVTVSGISGYVSELPYGFNIIYFTTALAYLVSITIIQIKVPDDSKNTETENGVSVLTRCLEQLKSIFEGFKNLNWTLYWDIFAMKAGTEIGMSMFTANMGIFLMEQFNIKGSKSGKFWMIAGTFIILTNILRIKLAKVHPKRNEYLTIFKCSVIFGFSILACSMISSMNVVYLTVAAIVGSYSFLGSTFFEMLTVRTTEVNRGKVISSYENVGLIAQFVAPFLSGILSFVMRTRLVLGLAFVPILVTGLVAYGKLSKANVKMKEK